jgi:hypothetical protein
MERATVEQPRRITARRASTAVLVPISARARSATLPPPAARISNARRASAVALV